MRPEEVPKNQVLTRPSEILDAMGPPPWVATVIEDGTFDVYVSASGRGQGNKEPHVHLDFNEAWLVGKHEIDFGIGHDPRFRAKFGDLIISHVDTVHIIWSVGDEPSIRIPLSKHDSDHSMLSTRQEGTKPFPARTSPPNLVHTVPEKIAAEKGPAPWSQDVMLDKYVRINLICTPHGDKSVRHAHPDAHVWWMVLKGELDWEIEGHGTVRARKGDLVFAPAGSMHQITTVGDEDALRYGVTPGVELRKVLPDGSEETYRSDFTGVPWSLT